MISNAPSCIVFDLGKVLLDFDYGIAVRALAKRSRKSLEEVAASLQDSALLLQYESGQLDTAGFAGQLCAACAYSGSMDEFSTCFGDIFAPIDPMIRLQAHLRQSGARTYIFSNTNELAVRHIRNSFPFFENFDGYVLSFEHGVMKPDSRLYEVFESMSGASGSEVVYIDDRLENVEAGNGRGWHGILHTTPQQTCHALQALGLSVPGTP